MFVCSSLIGSVWVEGGYSCLCAHGFQAALSCLHSFDGRSGTVVFAARVQSTRGHSNREQRFLLARFYGVGWLLGCKVWAEAVGGDMRSERMSLTCSRLLPGVADV